MREWNEFNKFEVADDLYLPAQGEGETKATQLTTAVSKLVYKWFNDGDVYDNVNSPMQGWCNDLSSYANWIDKYTPFGDILKDISGCYSDGEYTDLLYRLCEAACDLEMLAELNKEPKEGSVYDCDGVFQFSDEPEEEEDDYWEDEEDEDWDD